MEKKKSLFFGWNLCFSNNWCMLFRGKVRRSRKYRVLTDTSPTIILVATYLEWAITNLKMTLDFADFSGFSRSKLWCSWRRPAFVHRDCGRGAPLRQRDPIPRAPTRLCRHTVKERAEGKSHGGRGEPLWNNLNIVRLQTGWPGNICGK